MTCLCRARGFVPLAAAFLGLGVSAGAGYFASIYYSLHGHRKQATQSGFHEAFVGGGALAGLVVGGAAPYVLGDGLVKLSRTPYVAATALFAVGAAAIVWTYISARRGGRVRGEAE
jgi:hypothetical protein